MEITKEELLALHEQIKQLMEKRFQDPQIDNREIGELLTLIDQLKEKTEHYLFARFRRISTDVLIHKKRVNQPSDKDLELFNSGICPGCHKALAECTGKSGACIKNTRQ